MIKHQKYYSLQILRALAAWMVVYCHYVQSFYHNIELPTSSIGQFFSKYGILGVDLFFVVSGFVMYLSIQKKNYTGSQFILFRFLRILPIYWFYTLILILSIFLLSSTSYLTDYNAENVLKSIFLIPHENLNGYGKFPILYVGWTLTYELIYYAILGSAFLLTKRYPLILCSLILFCTPLILDEFIGIYKPLGHSNYLFWEFILGMLIAYYHRLLQNRSMALLISINIILFGILVFFCSINLNLWSKMGIASSLVFLFSLNEKRFSSNHVIVIFLVKLGNYSYSTYLLHIIVFGWFFYSFGNQFSRPMEVVILITSSLIIYWISFLTYKTLETGNWMEQTKKKIVGKSKIEPNS